MHSERAVSVPGQTYNSHQQQLQEHNPISGSNAALPVSTSATNQSVMLSAGQPAVPSNIFRVGAESALPSHGFIGSGGYVPAQYSSIYGIQRQSPSLTTSLQPYSTCFPGFGGTLGHRFNQGSLLPGTAQGRYPQIESYSAMLASMGNEAQHRITQVPDRMPRVQVPPVSVSHHLNPFLPSSAHLSSTGVQYPIIHSPSHHHLSDRISSPASAVATHTSTSTNTHEDVLSSRHLEKMARMQAGNTQQIRNEEVSREIRPYGNSSNLHEDMPIVSPGSYSAGGHVPKVSFDAVVKEYGGSRDCPAGRADMYIRSTLSGKEGSLKHRILTRPSDSDVPDDLSRGSAVQGLKDEPLPKRPKLSSHSSTPVTYGIQLSPAHQSDSQRSSNNHLHEARKAYHHSISNNNNIVDNKGASHHKSLSVQHIQYQQHASPDSGKYILQQPHSSQQVSSPSTPTSHEDQRCHVLYPPHFLKGSIIQLANGSLKRVEDLQTEDFVQSAEISSDLKVDNSTVVKIEEYLDTGTAMLSFSVGEQRIQVTVEATLEHPFFVFGQGWSSCSVSRTLARYGLDCQKLTVGDVCISLTHKDVSLKTSRTDQKQQTILADPQNNLPVTSSTETSQLKVHSSQRTLPFSSSSSGCTSSILPLPLKLQHADSNILTPVSSTPSLSVGRRRPSQTELPPPSSNIVPVKRDNSNNSRSRDLPRVESELKEVEDDSASFSASSVCKKKRSSSDQDLVTAAVEEDKDRKADASMGHKKQETLHTNSSNNGQL